MFHGATLALAGCALSALLSVAAVAADAPAGDSARGKKLYMEQFCFNCHGTAGQGGGVAGPRIAPNPFPWVAFEQQVRRPRQLMTPYGEKNLPQQDLIDIYAYLLTIKPGPAAKDLPLLSGF